MNSKHTTKTTKNHTSKKVPSRKFYYKSKWPYVRKILRKEHRPCYGNTAMHQVALAFLCGHYDVALNILPIEHLATKAPLAEFDIGVLEGKKIIIDPAINSAVARLGLNAVRLAKDIMNVTFDDGTPACVIETYENQAHVKATLGAILHVLKHHMDRKHKHWYEGNKCKTSSG